MQSEGVEVWIWIIITQSDQFQEAGSVAMLNIGVVLVVNGLYVISLFCYSQAVQAISTLLQVVSLSMCGIWIRSSSYDAFRLQFASYQINDFAAYSIAFVRYLFHQNLSQVVTWFQIATVLVLR